MNPHFYTLLEVAEMFGVPTDAVNDWIESGRLKESGRVTKGTFTFKRSTLSDIDDFMGRVAASDLRAARHPGLVAKNTG